MTSANSPLGFPRASRSKYAPLADWLSGQPHQIVELTFRQVEDVLGFQLPRSAYEYQAFWASGNTVAGELKRAGWHPRPRLAAGRVEFVRTHPREKAEREPVSARPLVEHATAPDLLLLGCVKSKRRGRHPARDLYTSALWEGRRRHAESAGAPWLILSAHYGLVWPDEELDYYDVSLLALPAPERREWARRVLERLDREYGPVAGKTIEIHAGQQYCDGVVAGLRRRGAMVVVPLERLNFGEQLAWYAERQRSVAPPASARPPDSRSPVPVPSKAAPGDAAEVAAIISSEFLAGKFDLSGRDAAPAVGWGGLPEFRAVDRLRALGPAPAEVRTFLTLMSAMDRARDADRLWDSGTALFERAPWAFSPRSVSAKPFRALRDALAVTGVSQRHGPDTAGWRLVAEALADDLSPKAVRRVVQDGVGDAQELLASVAAKDVLDQPWFPFLSGPKISVMWVRMMAAPGGAVVSNLRVLPVAVDVQVRKVTEYLGLTDTGQDDLESVRPQIQAVWRDAAAAAVGPAPLAGTGAALDPALWFLGKWGCTFCERFGRREPVSRACTRCRFPRIS